MRIIIVMGLACAGKSTYIERNFKDFKVIDLYKYQEENYSVDRIVRSNEKCKQDFLEAIKNGEDVVLEHTLLRAERRKEYIDAIREITDNNIECICICPSFNVLRQRRKMRNCYHGGDRAIQDALDIFEIPKTSEGFSSVIIENCEN